MKSENKNCQNCKKDFTIESEDFNFYEKIKVPPPTFCPECRTIRRLCWRNEMSFFKRPCSFPGHTENMISAFHPDEKLVIYDSKSWWGDSWDVMSHARDYDFSRPFFEQWREFRDDFPFQTLSNSNAVNSEYCSVADDSKDCYMISGSQACEHVMYSNRVFHIKDSADLYVAHRSELCYDDVICADSYHVLYSLNFKSCVDSYFLYDCVGCVNCFGCTNLRNKSYCMWNEQLSREEYTKRLDEFDLTDYQTILKLKEKFEELYLKSLHKFSNQIKVVNSTGDNLEKTKNCKMCFDITDDTEDSKFSHWGAYNIKDAYDSGPGFGASELTYEVFDTGLGNFRNLFTSVVYHSNDIEYCFNCYSSSSLFACIGVRSKKYCIFNKQYTKEEYESLILKIIKHMNDMPYVDSKGRKYKYGEFFPAELSPFAYNETVAQDYFPLTKEEALERGYKWRERKINDYKTTLEVENLPGSLKDTQDSITNETIRCLHDGKCQDRCSGAYRITEDELNLYKRLQVPLPRLCFGCRHDERLKRRNPMKLWRRTCMCNKENHFHGAEKCEIEFETPYAPDRPEIVYCEKCYQQEVY
ncbi:MAG: hypothetical protein V4699_00190 [Patescibacteria group bacterium]